MLKTLLTTILIAYFLISCKEENTISTQAFDRPPILNSLLESENSNKKPYKPYFTVEKIYTEFIHADGIRKDSMLAIKDNGKYIANYYHGLKPYFDIFAAQPEDGLTTPYIPIRYHNWTIKGTRLVTIPFYKGWKVTGDEYNFSYKSENGSISFTEYEKWYEQDSSTMTHTFEFGYDHVTGYVLKSNLKMHLKDEAVKSFDAMNMLRSDQSNVWPGKNKYPYNIYTPANGDSLEFFYSNLIAADLSDEKKFNDGNTKEIKIKNGGFFSFIQKDTVSPILFRTSDHMSFSNTTCNVWIDQHNNINFNNQKVDEEGFYNIDIDYYFTHLPAKTSNEIIKRAKEKDFRGKKLVSIQIGSLEDFENQPMPANQPHVRLCKGWWQKDFELSKEAYSGNQSLKINAKTRETILKDRYVDFIMTPQIHVYPNKKYQLKAMVKCNGPVTAFVQADLGDESPHDTLRTVRQSTDSSSSATWQEISLSFTAPNYDPCIDIRFRVVGDTGYALFDDFLFAEVKED